MSERRLSRKEIGILAVLDVAREPLCGGEIREMANVSGGAVYVLLSALEERGLVVVDRSDPDGRWRYSITPDGLVARYHDPPRRPWWKFWNLR